MFIHHAASAPAFEGEPMFELSLGKDNAIVPLIMTIFFVSHVNVNYTVYQLLFLIKNFGWSV